MSWLFRRFGFLGERDFFFFFRGKDYERERVELMLFFLGRWGRRWICFSWEERGKGKKNMNYPSIFFLGGFLDSSFPPMRGVTARYR